MKFSIREEVQGFSPYEAGLSIDEIKQKYGLEKVIKLASNENPLGVSPKTMKVLEKKANLAFRYPQSGSPSLVEALAKNIGIDKKRIVVGNGSDEVIDLLIRVMAEPKIHNIVAFEPCFSIYCTQAKLCGVELRRTPLNADFSFDFDKLLNLIDEKTALVFITNPDNPSGFAVTKEEILAFAKRLPQNCLLVVDEAYIDFAEEKYHCFSLLEEQKNIAIMRTFSKCFGLAGLRIGYGIFPEEIADYLCRVRLPFSLNILAEEAAIAALSDNEFYAKTIELTKQGRAFLTSEFTKLGFKVLSSQANFIFVVTPTTGMAKPLFQFLLERGMIIRTLSSYGQAEAFRISIGLAEENEMLISLIKEYISTC